MPHDYLQLQYSVALKLESNYLLESNKIRCKQTVNKQQRTENDLIDFFISLHVVLEVGLHSFFRQIYTMSIKKPLNEFEVIENIDNISFIDKAVMFIYTSNFDFENRLSEAKEHRKIIGKLRTFSGLRNKLLHGHSISSITIDERETRHSVTRGRINDSMFDLQIRLFNEIVSGVKFYLDCFVPPPESQWSDGFKEDLKKQYLSSDFLIIKLSKTKTMSQNR